MTLEHNFSPGATVSDRISEGGPSHLLGSWGVVLVCFNTVLCYQISTMSLFFLLHSLVNACLWGLRFSSTLVFRHPSDGHWLVFTGMVGLAAAHMLDQTRKW